MRRVKKQYLYIFPIVAALSATPLASLAVSPVELRDGEHDLISVNDDGNDEWEKPDANVMFAAGPGIENYCLRSNAVTAQQIADFATDIFIGKVTKTQLRFNSDDWVTNRCWAQVVVEKGIKGSASGQLWVEAYYTGGTDYWSPDNCYLAKNTEYLFVGKRRDRWPSHYPKVTIVVAGTNAGSRCTYAIALSDAGAELNEFQTIIKGGRRGSKSK